MNDSESGPIRLLLYPAEAAKALAISRSLLWNLTKAGKIPVKRINRCLRYDPTELREWLGRC
jgi:predicted DNA-binding transcriptional regulator AlpA